MHQHYKLPSGQVIVFNVHVQNKAVVANASLFDGENKNTIEALTYL